MDYKGSPSFDDFVSSLKFGILNLTPYHKCATSLSSTSADEIYTTVNYEFFFKLFFS